MNKVEIYEQCKIALHELKIRPLDLDDYIAHEKHEALVERRAKRAEIRANVALIASIISILLSLLDWHL